MLRRLCVELLDRVDYLLTPARLTVLDWLAPMPRDADRSRHPRRGRAATQGGPVARRSPAMIRAALVSAFVLLPIAAAAQRPAGEFPTEQQAQRHCPTDTVVWLNLPTGIYHFKGERWYGRTRHGAYVCEKEADQAGDRATRNGQ
jgi:hypothetical protein